MIRGVLIITLDRDSCVCFKQICSESLHLAVNVEEIYADNKICRDQKMFAIVKFKQHLLKENRWPHFTMTFGKDDFEYTFCITVYVTFQTIYVWPHFTWHGKDNFVYTFCSTMNILLVMSKNILPNNSLSGSLIYACKSYVCWRVCMRDCLWNGTCR